MPVRADGVVRLVATYEVVGRRAMMVFSFRHPAFGIPSPVDCENVADAYGIWENNGVGFGYALLRTSDSNFVSANVYSRDSRQRASFVDVPFSRGGLLFGLFGSPLPTSCAPIIRWRGADSPRPIGRTYAVGMTELVQGSGADKELIGGIYTATLATIFNHLREVVRGSCGYVQCIVSETSRAGPRRLLAVRDVADAGVYELMGTQRRRTRPG